MCFKQNTDKNKILYPSTRVFLLAWAKTYSTKQQKP